MAELKDYGQVYTSDILVVGGGMSGLVTAIKAKETNPEADILVIDKGTIGWSGQATKAGNGIRATENEGLLSVLAAMGYLINANTEFLSDQEFLMKYLEVHTDNIEYMHHCGVQTSVNDDGSVLYHPFIPHALRTSANEINVCRSLRNFAYKLGIRMLSRVNIFEFLTSKTGKVIGAIGFDMDKGECRIFHAKAVAMATQGCHFKKIGLEFMGYGTAVGAAYRVGALMRNVEFSTQTDVVFKKNNTPIYGGFNIIYNRNGENIKEKYCGKGVPLMEVDTRLVLGMLEEIKAGNGPLYCDDAHPDEVRKIFGGTRPEEIQPHTPDKMIWEEHVMQKTAERFGDVGETPETTIKMVIQVEPIKVDTHYRTDVEGLWAPGKVSTQGCAYFGWTRGDGVGNASTTGIMAGEDMGSYVVGQDFDEISLEQVAALKEKIYAPLHRSGNRKPAEIFDMIERIIFSVDRALAKSEESILAELEEIEEMKKIIPELTADDPHNLAKCLEAADSVLCLEMVYRSALMRTESRGQMYPHMRVDYPERDDKNWLKWINIKQGTDGNMELFTEDIPMWRYPIRPDGYVIPEGHKEEFYTPENPMAPVVAEILQKIGEEMKKAQSGQN